MTLWPHTLNFCWWTQSFRILQFHQQLLHANWSWRWKWKPSTISIYSFLLLSYNRLLSYRFHNSIGNWFSVFPLVNPAWKFKYACSKSIEITTSGGLEKRVDMQGHIYRNRAPKLSPSLFNPFSKCFASK